MTPFLNQPHLMALGVLLGVLICFFSYKLWMLQRLLKQYKRELSLAKSTLSTIHQFQSHRVRGPLTNILAITDLLTGEPNHLSKEETHSLFTDLKSSARELDRIIGEIVIQSQTF
jgi:light-regulated signal transduction histidine kinase (bacteriophytochrome)